MKRLALALLCGVALPAHADIQFACHFEDRPVDCGFQLQAADADRAQAVEGRTGRGTQLTTKSGDNNIVGSGDMERADMWLTQEQTGGFEGSEQWWTHSLMLPADFAMPTWQMYVVMDFHHTGSTGQANVQISFASGRLELRLSAQGVSRQFDLGVPKKGAWYEFVHHVKWSSGGGGFLDTWVNGKRMVSYQGPTLYAGQGTYLKLANYHTPVCDPYPGCTGPSSSVLHDRVIRATTAWEVSSTQLEGYPLGVPPAQVPTVEATTMKWAALSFLLIAMALFVIASAPWFPPAQVERIKALALAFATLAAAALVLP